MVFVSALVTTISVVFIAPTARVILDDDGFLIHVGVGMLWYEWLPLKNKRLTWDQVVNVVMVTPKWWYPIRLITVVGSDGLRVQTFALGTCISNTPAGLEFLSRHVDKSKIDDHVLTLIEKTLAK